VAISAGLLNQWPVKAGLRGRRPPLPLKKEEQADWGLHSSRTRASLRGLGDSTSSSSADIWLGKPIGDGNRLESG